MTYCHGPSASCTGAQGFPQHIRQRESHSNRRSTPKPVRIPVFSCSHFLFYLEILPLRVSSCFSVPPVFSSLPLVLFHPFAHLSSASLHLFLIPSFVCLYIVFVLLSVRSVFLRLPPCSPVSLLCLPPWSSVFNGIAFLFCPVVLFAVSPHVSPGYVSVFCFSCFSLICTLLWFAFVSAL